MAKTSGGVRSLGTRETAKNNRRKEFASQLTSGKYDLLNSQFNDKSGGYYLTESSPKKHKPEEYEVAKYLAKNGYKVVLKDEAGISIKKEGRLFGISYEQRTPIGQGETNIATALRHGRDKKAAIMVIYMKYGKHPRSVVEQGIRDFESKSKYRFKEILIVTKDGRLHKHKHNKK